MMTKAVKDLSDNILSLAVEQYQMVVGLMESGLPAKEAIEIVKGWIATQLEGQVEYSVSTTTSLGLEGEVGFSMFKISAAYSKETKILEAGRIKIVMSSNGSLPDFSEDLEKNKDILKMLLEARDGKAAG